MDPKSKPGTERYRDEQRQDRGPTYGGEDWDKADERGDDRFGHARNDDANPLELVKSDAEIDGEPFEADAPNAESGGEQAGIGRGEKPRKEASRAKNVKGSSSK